MKDSICLNRSITAESSYKLDSFDKLSTTFQFDKDGAVIRSIDV